MRGFLFVAAAALLPTTTAAEKLAVVPHPDTEIVTEFDRSRAHEVVAELARALENDYVFPEEGRDYAAMLRSNVAAGKYSNSANPGAFAKAVTEDLQAVHPDGHLRVHVVPPEARNGPQTEDGGGEVAPNPELNTITQAGWLSDGVVHIAFDAFFGTPATMTALEQFIANHAGARTLIIDIRGHRGGGLEEMDLLLPHIFAEPQTLLAMDTRATVFERVGSVIGEGRLRRVAAPEGVVRDEHYVVPAAEGAFHKSKVYVLTSKRSASAAEHLALALKRTGRAVLIGETTYGAGNFGSMVPLDPDFSYSAFIPNGRTFDPDTGEGWEGAGVVPHVACSAEEALDQALLLANAK